MLENVINNYQILNIKILMLLINGLMTYPDDECIRFRTTAAAATSVPTPGWVLFMVVTGLVRRWMRDGFDGAEVDWYRTMTTTRNICKNKRFAPLPLSPTPDWRGFGINTIIIIIITVTLPHARCVTRGCWFIVLSAGMSDAISSSGRHAPPGGTSAFRNLFAIFHI